MTKEEFASMLNFRHYGSELSKSDEQLAKLNGLVVVYGASDDLMEFAGAINDEIGAHNGTTAYVTTDGLFGDEECDSQCKFFEAAQRKAIPIKAIWHDRDEYAWTYETAIPHATFEILDGDEMFCKGIVFALADVATTQATSAGSVG